MPALRDVQRRFRRALLSDGAADFVDFLSEGELPAALRLGVHRNNVVVSLCDALADVYPVARRLVGDPFFRAMARAFVRAEPPRVRVLAAYGGAFPRFIARFPPVDALPYLADVARLEWAHHRAHYAAPVEPLSAAWLATLPAGAAAGLRPPLHPAARAIRSRWPIERIWRANRAGAAVSEVIRLDEGGGDLIVVRPRHEVEVIRLPKGAFPIFRALEEGRELTFAEAIETAAEPGAEPQRALAALLAAGAFSRLESGMVEELR